MKKPTVEQMRQELLSSKDRQKNLSRLLKDSAVKKRLYHGTTAHDEYADEEGQAFKQFTGRPTWLAEEPYTAGGYSKGTGSTYPVYAQVKNPLKLNFDANDDAEKAFPLARKLGVDIEHIVATQKPEKAWEVINHPSFIDAVENAGYDGIQVKEGGYKTHGVLDPRKIKSAIGNRGTYDPNDPDITKAEGGSVKPKLIEDIPNEDWLKGKVDYALQKGRNSYGVPHRGSITGYYDKPVHVPLKVLSKLRGQSNEQENVRPESLDYIRKNWKEVSKQHPYIEVAHNGEAWVSEGNHRIMVANEKGLDSMPVQIRYFDGGQRKDGPLHPSKILSPDESIVKKADGGTVNQGGNMPTLAEMRAMLMKRGNPIEMQSIGVNEAPGITPKAYIPPDRPESFQPAPGGVATPMTGMPIGGIDQSRVQPGQQLMPAQPMPGTSEQPGKTPAGQPQGNMPNLQPSPLPSGFPMAGGPQQPAPAGQSNILQMTPQGRALSAIGPAQGGQNMAKGGSARMSREQRAKVAIAMRIKQGAEQKMAGGGSAQQKAGVKFSYTPAQMAAMARAAAARNPNVMAAKQGTTKLDDLFNTSLYGNRYIQEAATQQGKLGLLDALNRVNQQMASGQGLYKQGDVTSRVPAWAYDQAGNLNPNLYSALFPRLNSYFLPDYAEMDPTQYYQGSVSALDKAFVNANKAASRDNPDYVSQLGGLQNKYDQMRLANQRLFYGYGSGAGLTPDFVSTDVENRARGFLDPKNAADINYLRTSDNYNIPLAFDAARGELTPDQAQAIQQTLAGTYGSTAGGTFKSAAESNLGTLQDQLAQYQQNLQYAGSGDPFKDPLRGNTGMTEEQRNAWRSDTQKNIDRLTKEAIPKAQQDLENWNKQYSGYQQQFANVDPSKISSGELLTQLGLVKKPGGMAKGGSVKQQGVTMGSPKQTRMVFQAEGPGGVKGINVPRHMWEGSSGVFQKGTRTGQEFKTPGMKDINAMRAKVYGSENRDPLTIGQIGRIHKDTLAEHFKKPLDEQVKAEKEALNRLREAGHIGKTANTLDESEKLDTVRHEHDEEGRTHVGYASKGVAGHALYTSGHGKNMKHHVINTCPGQTEGCGGGKDAKGVVDTTKGTCFAPVAEAQYPGAAIRRASHEQAKHDPAMTRDWILAHTGSMREAANAADKKNQRMLFRPNVVDETDTSSRHVIRHLNEQRKADGKPGIIANSYGKTNELHDPENGYYVTHSNVGPKVKNGREISENIGRDKQRVSNTILAANNKGDFTNEQGNKTPPKGSYMVTNVKRGSPLSKKMQEHITHAKYWSTGREEHELTPEEKAEGPEGHYGPSGRKTTPEKAHYGHTTLNGRRYDYQKQHILHPRLVQVGENKDGTPHMIPTDSRFKDTEFLPKDRFKTKNGKEAGHILMTTPTESTSNLGHETSFTHHVDEKSIKHAMSNNGEYEIDKPEDQEKARGKEYAAPQPISIVKKAMGGSIESRHPGLSDDDFHAFPERNFAAQRHLAMRRGDDEERPQKHHNAVVVHKDTNTMRHEMMMRRKG